MDWFENRKIAVKLIMAFALLAATVGFVGLSGLQDLETIEGNLTEMYDKNALGMFHLSEASDGSSLVGRAVDNAVFEGETAKVEKHIADIRSHRDNFRTEFGQYQERIVSQGTKDEARQLLSVWETLIPKQDAVLQLVLQKKDAEARDRLKEIHDLEDDLEARFDKLNHEKLALMQKTEADAEAQYATTRRNVIVMITLALLGAMGLGLFLANRITRPIARVVALLQKIAGGDLTETVAVDRKDEVGDILRAAAAMSQSLRTLIAETKAGANTMAGATSQINASSRRNVETSQMQLSAVQETTTSATELQETARVAGERAREIQTALASTAESGQSIKVQLGEATELLGRAREELLAIVGSVQDLSGRNQQIGEIIESVSDVADQTQLLAVNAAIEAAKAGEVGRGFGVVATEMKALAEQSKKSAQRIRGIVGEVQRATADTVRQVETGQARLQEALDPVSAILPKIDRLTVQVDESGQSGRQIVAIVAQQGAGVEQISQAMKSINGGVQEGLAQTQQVERAAESLNLLAARLRDTIAAYRV